ncbi:hypothetical protein L1049_024138 [Liquidambar formosana]|uniref:RING-type E3 ubiquitin transferase n=1 Tax=Liquidambar formosana TaxID=63359 RepID=A0AAP0S012_LIQFO
MGTDVAEAVETLPDPCAIKVHRMMCTELLNLVDRISRIFPEIEAARPRCSSGIQSLCLLHSAIEKAKSLLWYCSESSKLYLALTGDTIVLRCEKTRKLLVQSLTQIQNMVPVMLAVEISRIIDDLRSVTFSLDSSEEEAGKFLRALLRLDTSASDSRENSEVEALKHAALRLHIASPKDLLIERRSIKNLLDKVSEKEPKKRKTLMYLFHLLKNHGKQIIGELAENACAQHKGSFALANSNNRPLYGQSVEVESHVGFGQDEAQTDMLSRHEAQTDMLRRPIIPEEFKCPISSKLMYDPVVIASGQTFERMWIGKWFDEGHDFCPKTKMKLANLSLTPDTDMKDLISKWCMDHGISIADPCIQPAAFHTWETSSNSITSLNSSMNDLNLQLDLSNLSLGSLDISYNSDSSYLKIQDGLSLQTTDDSHRHQSYVNAHETDPEYLSKLAALPWASQCKMVEDVKTHLNYNDESCHSMSSENFVEPLIRFLKGAFDQHDVEALKSGSQLLLAYVRKIRSRIPYFPEDAFTLLASFLDSEVTEEALAIMAVLSGNISYGSKIAASGALTSIQKILDTQTREFQEPAIKILCNLSSNSDTRFHIAPLEYIPKLVPLFDDKALARYCIIILKNLCDTEEARVSIAETNGCIASIAELLEADSTEDQEHAVAVLLSLCSQRIQYCQLVMNEGVIPALFNMSVNGNDKGKASAMEMLRLLRDIDYNDGRDCSGSNLDNSRDSSNHSKENKSSSKASGFFGLKFSVFSKPSSFTPKKKK